MQGRGSGAVREFALYGETTGETDEFGLPVRYNWAAEYRGQRDGRLRPHAGARAGVAEPHDQHRHRLRLRRQADRAALPGAGAGLGARARRPTPSRRGRSCRADRRPRSRPSSSTTTCSTSTTCSASGSSRRGCTARVTIREENATAALEVMSRFAVDPQWLIYLPPTMSPSETTPASRACWNTRPRRSPTSAREGVAAVVCEEKHMGSRAVVVVCRDARRPRAALRRRRATAPASSTPAPAGASSTTPRSRPRCSPACAPPSTPPGSGTSSTTDWVCLDCELMPWSAKAQELLRQQYAAVGAAGARRRWPRRSRRWRPPARPRRRRRRPARARRASGARRPWPLRRRLPPLLLAGRVARRPAARAVPPAGQRGRASTSTRTTSGTWRRSRRLAAADAGAAAGDAAPRGRPRPTPASEAGGDRLVGGADRARRRRHGRQAARLRRPRRRGAWSSRR